MTIKLTIFCLAAGLASTPALGFPGGGNHPSPEEVQAVQAELFAAADSDGDGALGIAEFTTFTELARAERVQRHFDRLDQDGDGVVSSTELESGEHPRPRRGLR